MEETLFLPAITQVSPVCGQSEVLLPTADDSTLRTLYRIYGHHQCWSDHSFTPHGEAFRRPPAYTVREKMLDSSNFLRT